MFLTSTGEKEPGAYANVWWLEGKNSVETNDNGDFVIKQIKGDNITLIAAYVGYTQDTIKVYENGVNLQQSAQTLHRHCKGDLSRQGDCFYTCTGK